MAGGDGQLRSPPLLGCAASPNGVLVAWIRFAPPERSSRKVKGASANFVGVVWIYVLAQTQHGAFLSFYTAK